MDEPRTHYQLSFTARQALLLFVGLLGALAVAYVFGLLTGLAGRESPVRAPAVASAETPAASPTSDALEIPRAVRGLAPVRGAARTPSPQQMASMSTPAATAVAGAAPTPSPGLHLFEDAPEAARGSARRPERTGKIPLEADRPPAGNPAVRTASFWVQAISASSDKEARSTRDRLAARGYPCTVVPGPGPRGKVYRVRVGPYATRDEADRVADRLKTREKLRPWVVPPGK